MKIKKIAALFTVVLLCSLTPMSALAASTTESTPSIQPYALINYGNFYLSGGATRLIRYNGANFSIRAGQTVSITYSSPVALNLYFHNSSTGTNTRVFGSYTPNRGVTGYFYITNPTNTTVYVTNMSVYY